MLHLKSPLVCGVWSYMHLGIPCKSQKQPCVAPSPEQRVRHQCITQPWTLNSITHQGSVSGTACCFFSTGAMTLSSVASAALSPLLGVLAAIAL